MLRTGARRFGAESGQSLLETAVSMAIIFILLFWIIEVCSLVYTYVTLNDAANEGVRYAVVHNDDGDAGWPNTIARTQSFAALSMHNTSSISVSVTPSSNAQAPTPIVVTVSYSYVPWLGSFSPTMTVAATGVTIGPE